MENDKKDILLKEDILTEIDAETILLGLGFIPVIGEAFDTILIIKYFKEERWIEAFLMMIALIPVVGDAAVKPFLFMGRGLKAFSGTAKFSSVLQKNKKFAGLYKKISPYFGSPVAAKLSTQISKKYPKIAPKIKNAKSFHINAAGKLKAGGAKTMIRKKAKQGVGYGSQQLFRNKALGKYLEKSGGKLPKKGLTSWYNLVYKARGARKNAFRKALLSSNLLGALGLPNIEAFEDYITTDEGAEKVMNTPEFQQVYNQTTSPQDEMSLMKQIESQGSQESNSSSDFGMGMLSIPLMKQFAAAVL